LKTKIKEWLRTYGSALTEVPGWPDAPVSARVRRAMPVMIPCLGMLLILIWTLAIHAPRVRAQHAALQPLLILESSISKLRLAFSEQQAAEIAERAAGASQLLLESPAEVPTFLRSLKKEAADRGWDANFFVADSTEDPPAQDAVIGYLPVRAKLTPNPGKTDPFPSLLALLERLSTSGKRIDLVRLAVRADEHRWHLVEINFRLAYPLPR
jgi:hypothetical protein